jgi:hypothetical protein
MSRLLSLVCELVVVCFAVASLAEGDSGGQMKTGKIKSVDAKAKTFVVDLPARPLTFTVNDKTIYAIDGKVSTFDAVVKVDRKVTVTYLRQEEKRLATKVEAKSAEPAK